METISITQIKTIKEEIVVNLELYKSYVKNQKSDLNSRQYGSEMSIVLMELLVVLKT